MCFRAPLPNMWVSRTLDPWLHGEDGVGLGKAWFPRQGFSSSPPQSSLCVCGKVSSRIQSAHTSSSLWVQPGEPGSQSWEQKVGKELGAQPAGWKTFREAAERNTSVFFSCWVVTRRDRATWGSSSQKNKQEGKCLHAVQSQPAASQGHLLTGRLLTGCVTPVATHS